MKAALQGVKVVEYAEYISAPYCGKMLADMGAEVVKIEKPAMGDSSRRIGPFPKDTPHKEKSGLFLYLNTNKFGITLNPGKPTGKRVFQKLLEDVDVLIEDQRPGKMDNIGLGWDHLNSLNPALVMTSITAFGQTGPYKNFKGGDLIAWQMGGGGYVTPRYAGTTEQEPLRAAQLASFISGINGAIATMCALRVQRRSGVGQHVDISQMESVIHLISEHIAYPPYENWSPSRAARPWAAPRHFFKCRDGWVYLYVDEPHHWERFVEVMGNPEWAGVELFKTKYSRGDNWEGLQPLLAEWAKDKTRAEVFEIGKTQGIPLTPGNTVADIFASRQLEEREYLVDIEHPAAGRLKYPGPPYKFSKTPWAIGKPAPLLGQHNREIYCDRLGYSKEELAEMYRAGII